MMTEQHKKNLSLLNSFFDQIYVLTIERAHERHKAITDELQGLNFSFFYGFDKNSLSIEELEKQGIYNSVTAKHYSRYNKPLKLGEIACSMGHKAIYEDMLKNNYQNALILEDDVRIDINASAFFADVLNQLPHNWELLYLDYSKNELSPTFGFIKQWVYYAQRKLGFLKWSKTTIKYLFAKPFSKNLKSAGYHDFTSAYAITKSCAEKLIKIHTPITLQSDTALAHAATNQTVVGFIAVPKVFKQLSQDKENQYASFVED
jgi:glycosyl transferase family 25